MTTCDHRELQPLSTADAVAATLEYGVGPDEEHFQVLVNLIQSTDPDERVEAALCDGCGEIFYRLVTT